MADSIVQPAAQWLGTLLINEANTLFAVRYQVGELQEKLIYLQGYLRDADARKSERVGALIEHIRKLAYDTEDVIDTYILFKGEAKFHRFYRRCRLMTKFAYFVYNGYNIYQVGSQMQKIRSRFDDVTKSFNHYGVSRIVESEIGLSRPLSNDGEKYTRIPRSYPYDDKDGEYFVGLEEISNLVGLLMNEENQHIKVLAIVGMGGCGKTTLARKLYNHTYTKEYFDFTVWVFISQEWSTRHVLSQILRKVSGLSEKRPYDECDVDELVEMLRDILQEKSYLVVLDDVWRKEVLEDIFPALPWGIVGGGSKVIITTRNQDVLQLNNLQQSTHIHSPRPLSEEESWELFSELALRNRTPTGCTKESLEILGKDMLRKCDGLPLAIVALAGILNTKHSFREWKLVKEAVRARVMDVTGINMYGRVGDMLALSYDDLPYALKPCFLYLGLFPEDCQIPTGMLTRMWIAEGLVIEKGTMTPEDVARQHLEELSNRFMIQIARINHKGDIKVIRLHDLLHELCVKKAREQNFLEIYTPSSEPVINTSELTRHIQPRRAALHGSVSFPTRDSHIRSLVLLTQSSVSLSAYLDKKTVDIERVHHTFKLLRLLSLWGVKTVSGTLPVEIGRLIHLRYLEIRATNIVELPKSIGKLRNLVTLDYRKVDMDNNKVGIKIAKELSELLLLRHLFLPIECPWNIGELKLSNMTSLQTLWGVKPNEGGKWLSEEVPKLSETLKKLKIELSKETELEAVFNSPSLTKDQLETLHLELKGGIALHNVNVQPLRSCKSLLKLILIGEIRLRLSLLLPSNLAMLELKGSVLKDANSMEALGEMAHLKRIKMSNSYMGTEFTCKFGSFPRLEELYLENLQNLCEWRIEQGAMPYLTSLGIVACTQLEEFPRGLNFVTSLKHLDFDGMPSSFNKMAIECGWSQRLRLPHNCEAIVKYSDYPVDLSSIRKVLEQLTVGVYLNERKQKYWITKHESHYNCFMIYAKGIHIVWGDDSNYWSWPLWDDIEEGDGTQIAVAELKRVCWLETSGVFNTSNLSPNVTYEVAYEIMLKRSADSWSSGIIHFVLSLPDGSIHKNDQTLHDRAKDEWIRVSVGEFKNIPVNLEDTIKFSFYAEDQGSWKSGLVIKGVSIEPKQM